MSCSYYTFRQNDFYCTKKGDYVNSDTYYKYCRNYDYDDCPIYKSDSSGGCYLTSACMYSKGLEDNCHELTTLRKFRDSWLKNSENGKDLIDTYYLIAPKIVSEINKTKDSKSVYEMIYDKMVKPCVELIENNKFDEALDLYKSVTLELKTIYCN